MKYLLDWFAPAPSSLIPQEVHPQTAAKVWSWAIFGTGIQWGQGAQKESAVEIAREIAVVLTAGCTSDR